MREKPRGETDEEDRNTVAFTSATEQWVRMRTVKHTAEAAEREKSSANDHLAVF